MSLANVATPAAHAVTDEDPAFVLNQNDLEFILRQVQISEAHAADSLSPSNYELLCADPDDSSGKCVPNTMNTFGVRTVDGTYNNLVVGQNGFGASDGTFPRLLDPVWREAETVPAGAPANNPANTAVCGNAGPPSPFAQTCYSQTEGFVYDSEPRTVSNLIVDQTTNNPAILNQLDAGTATLIPGTDRVTTPNTAADEELSAPFNTFMGFFGQFFDHGLDLIAKGGHGTLVVPLEEDDPLYDPESNTNFLMLTRATAPKTRPATPPASTPTSRPRSSTRTRPTRRTRRTRCSSASTTRLPTTPAGSSRATSAAASVAAWRPGTT